MFEERTIGVLHKRIISTVITRMDERRAAYFGRVVDRLEQDLRTDLYPNLPILVLKETVEVLPTYLDPGIVVNHLFQFLNTDKDILTRVIHGAQYTADNTVLAPYCASFVENIIRDTLSSVDATEEDNNGRTEYHLAWPIAPDDFPYADTENEEDKD